MSLARITEILERVFPGEVDFQASGSTATTITKGEANKKWKSIHITNDDSGTMEFEINSKRVTVKSGESFDERFVPFNQVIILSNLNYRIILRV